MCHSELESGECPLVWRQVLWTQLKTPKGGATTIGDFWEVEKGSYPNNPQEISSK